MVRRGGAGKRKRAIVGDEGTRARRRREARSLIRGAYPRDGSPVDPEALAIVRDYAPADVIRVLMDRNIPEDLLVDLLIALLPPSFSDPTASPIPTQPGYDWQPPPSPGADADAGTGAGRRKRGRPRKMVGGVVISPAQRSAIEDFLNMHYTSFLRSRYNPDKFEKVKKEIFDEVIPEMSSMGAINKKLAEQLMNRYEARR